MNGMHSDPHLNWWGICQCLCGLCESDGPSIGQCICSDCQHQASDHFNENDSIGPRERVG